MEMVESIVEWLSKQPHLPQIEDREVMRKFLINCKYRLQKTKEKIENYYSARTNLPSLFQNRDPTTEEMRVSSNHGMFFPLPKRTEKGHLVCLTKFTPDSDDYDVTDYAKRVFMVYDIMMCEEEGKMDYIVVVDFRDFSFRHFLNLARIAKTFMDTIQNVVPATLKGIHYVNPPLFADKVAEFFKLLVKPKLRERFFVHKNMEHFYEILGDRDVLPIDLGGKEPPIAELNDQYQKKLESYKNWFEKEEHIRSNEDLRPPNSKNSWLMGTEGSFKKLAID